MEIHQAVRALRNQRQDDPESPWCLVSAVVLGLYESTGGGLYGESAVICWGRSLLRLAVVCVGAGTPPCWR